MKNIITITATGALTLFLLNCQTSKTKISNLISVRMPNSTTFTPAELETSDKDIAFLDMISTLNMEDATMQKSEANIGKYFFEYKSTHTSVGIKVSKIELEDGKLDTDKIGKWVPKNSANDVEAQVVAYFIGRFLNMRNLVVPSAYHTVGPKVLALFKTMLQCEKEKKGQHKDNCILIRDAIKKNPNSMIGSFVDHVKDEKEVPNMNTFKGSYANNGKLNPNHAIAKFIKANGPMPSAEKKMDLGVSFEIAPKKFVKGTETELELSRQFSKIMVLDILTGQWDRFSGGNIEAVYKEKKEVVQFLAIDNGGASMKGAAKLLYWEAVTRFDKDQIDRVQHLLALLKSDPAGTSAGLGLVSQPASLIARCEKLLEHVAAQVKAHGAENTFFP